MWTCPKCSRIFGHVNQMHSCKTVPFESHFADKEQAKELFDTFLELVKKEIGQCKTVSLPCCIHLFGTYDFLAALPKKDRLEIRFALNRQLNTQRLKTAVPMSAKIYKNCFDIFNKKQLDQEFMDWVRESYHLKD